MVRKVIHTTEYSAPSVEVLEIASEQVFAGSGTDAYSDWGGAGEAGSIEFGDSYDL